MITKIVKKYRIICRNDKTPSAKGEEISKLRDVFEENGSLSSCNSNEEDLDNLCCALLWKSHLSGSAQELREICNEQVCFRMSFKWVERCGVSLVRSGWLFRAVCTATQRARLPNLVQWHRLSMASLILDVNADRNVDCLSLVSDVPRRDSLKRLTDSNAHCVVYLLRTTKPMKAFAKKRRNTWEPKIFEKWEIWNEKTIIF